MIVERTEDGRRTEIMIWPSEEYRDQWRMGYRVYCADFDMSNEGQGPLFARRLPPRATISPLGLRTPCTVDQAREHAIELLFVAGVAAGLEAEKRAAYFARFPDDPEAPKPRAEAQAPAEEPGPDDYDAILKELRKRRMNSPSG